jgi:hypothetical protein
MASEGVSLDIIHGVAVFTSCLTSHVLLTKNLKVLKSNNDLILLINGLSKKAWFTQQMQNRIENFAIEQFNGI